MLSEAIIKIENQRRDFAANSREYAISSVLIQLCREMPQLAAAVAASDKTVNNCVKALEDHARKNQSGGCGVIDAESGTKIFCDFYGVAGDASAVPSFATPAPAASGTNGNVVNILDFLE